MWERRAFAKGRHDIQLRCHGARTMCWPQQHTYRRCKAMHKLKHPLSKWNSHSFFPSFLPFFTIIHYLPHSFYIKLVLALRATHWQGVRTERVNMAAKCRVGRQTVQIRDSCKRYTTGQNKIELLKYVFESIFFIHSSATFYCLNKQTNYSFEKNRVKI